jgi:tetratricopeptide (TPR) repeat protein
MAITDRLLRQGSTDPKVRSERSIEYQNLALMQDAAGNRVQALESYRMNQALKLDILRTNPDYRKIRRSLGMATVLLGSAMARMGARDEALKTLEQGIAFYESVAKGDDEINVKRELAVSKQKLGDILLMNGNIAAAQASYRDARRTLEPMAKADLQNTLLQLDVAGVDYEEGRLLAVNGRYQEALLLLQRSLRMFEELHAQDRSMDDIPHGLSTVYIWQGEAEMGMRDLRAALESYRKSADTLQAPPAKSMHDDSRCELIVSLTKIGDSLANMGDLKPASASYQKALDLAQPSAASERHDVPILYAVAGLYSGLGDVSSAEARRARDPALRSKMWNQARTSYQQSLDVWKQIPNPSRMSATGLPASDRRQIAARLAALPH